MTCIRGLTVIEHVFFLLWVLHFIRFFLLILHQLLAFIDLPGVRGNNIFLIEFGWMKLKWWIIAWSYRFVIPPNNEVVEGYIGFTPSVCPSVCPSVRLSRLPCPLCDIYSSGWILSIIATNDHYHARVCRTQWPLTLIFKVIRPWLRKSCPLCSVYSSGWILFIFGTNDHYY